MIRVLLQILPSTSARVFSSHLRITKLMALPTANKNDGKTKSVGVKPFHLACCRGAKVKEPSPEVFTMIIKQMVRPLKTSRARNRWLDDMAFDFAETEYTYFLLA